MTGDYDVIIVGAGIGGLSCGALLARRGLRVLVIEQHHKIGGYCTSFQRKGFVFDGGVEAISGLGEKGPVRCLFRELGLDPEEFFIRTREEYIIGDRRLKIPERAEDLVELLKREFPDEEQNIPRFFREAEKVYREIYQDVAENGGTPLPPPLLYRVRGPQALLDYPKNHPHHYQWMQKSFQEVLDTYFQNRELKAFLSVLTAYLGAGAKDLNADAMAIIFGYYFDGGYYPRGGSQRLADTLAGVIGRHGGEIRTGCLVEQILLENGAVYGVAAGGKEYRSRIVVSNANAKNTFFSLVGKEHLPDWFTAYLGTLKESVSAFMVYLGVEMNLAGYSPLLKVIKDEGGVGIVISSNLDPSLAPPGKASVHLITLLPAGADDWPGEEEEYRQKKKEFAEKLISLAEQAIPGLSRHVAVTDAATPRTFARYSLNPKGCIYGFEQSRHAPPRPYFKTPVKGLYLAGASTFPGGGIEAVVISGIIAANDITGWRLSG
ncbi:MAG: NAD(P)/FAD-dependent oxidoreductase [Moorella sp. (in: Bacteria)]|nr:NAD(P)/FAD-dependent oxidoreductase [Moorella sp. (in: firmicutes)]